MGLGRGEEWRGERGRESGVSGLSGLRAEASRPLVFPPYKTGGDAYCAESVAASVAFDDGSWEQV